jgi:hypothetical protein
MPPKNAKRNEKDRKRRADGLLRHQQDLAEKKAEIDHLHGSLTGVLGQLATFEGAAEIIRDYQKCMQPWDDNELIDLEYCRGCSGRGIRDGMEIARLTAICRKTKCGPLENELVRLRAQMLADLEERNTDLEEGRDNFESMYALFEKQLARKDAALEAEEKERADLEATLVTRTRGGKRRTEGPDGDDGDGGSCGGIRWRSECRGTGLPASKAAA